jgi:hypothetical protein
LNIPIFIVKKIMGRDSLFQRVKNSIRGQKSSFCSRATSVTLLESGREIPVNLVVNYIDCDNKQKVVNYEEVLRNNNYIPDCVQGGCPISITDDNKSSYKSFVQFGTTDCNTPPSSMSVILQPCSRGESYIVDPTGYNLTQGGVYNIQLTPLGGNPLVITQCYTVGPQTDQQASYNITGQVENVGDCNMCGRQPL